MNDIDTNILEKFRDIIPKLSEEEQDKLLAFSAGMQMIIKNRTEKGEENIN